MKIVLSDWGKIRMHYSALRYLLPRRVVPKTKTHGTGTRFTSKYRYTYAWLWWDISFGKPVN